MNRLILAFLLLHSVSACAQTVGQYEIRKRTSTGFTSYGVTLSNGQVIGQTAGVPAAITVSGGGGGATAWGDITGTLANQTDLGTALGLKLSIASAASTYEPILAAGTTGQYYRGDKSWQTLNASAVGLGNVSNALQLVASNNLSDLASASTARSNLGLVTSAGGNGAADSGKVAVYNAAGSLTAGYALAVTSGSLTYPIAELRSEQMVFAQSDPLSGTLNYTTLTASRTWTLPNASGTIITTGNLSAITALPLDSISGFGTGIATALAINAGSAGAPVLFDGAGGTPSSITLTNATGTAASLTAGQATAALGLKSATTTVSVSAATAPTSGQVLTATSGTAATWQTPSGGGSGKTAQVVTTSTTTTGSTTAIIPYDNTIPQISEGTSVGIDTAITPTSASSTLIIDVEISAGASNAATEFVAALFVDSTADALRAADATIAASGMTVLRFRYIVSAASTTARTYRARYGTGVAGTAYINRSQTNATLYGGALSCSMTVTEILP